MSGENPGFFGSCSPCSPCCDNKSERATIKVQADQPVVSVPVYQDVLRRDKFVEVPQVTLHDTLVPKVYTQETIHEIPNAGISYSEKPIEVESVKYVEKTTSTPVPMGYSPKFVPTWDIKEVPRPVPKYYGEQKIIEVDVPVVKYETKYVDKEIVVEVKEKVVPKITEVEKPVEVVKYEWKEQFQDVPVYKYVPKFDVELECPPPLIVPYPEQKFVKVPPIEESPNYNCYSFCENLCCQPNVDQGSMQQKQTWSSTGEPKYTNIGPSDPHSPVDYSQFGVQEGMPLYPLASPQFDSNYNNIPEAETSKTPEKTSSDSWFCWPFCKQSPTEKCKPEEPEPYEGYPKGMPTDFADYFKAKEAEMNQMRKSTIESRTEPGVASELEPTVEYKGSVQKPSIFGGSLDPITFKLHAVEVHQFISLPDLETPQFIQTLPEIDTSSKRAELESFFGPVPEGWADPGITGMPAPIMNDILQGNYQTKGRFTSNDFAKHFTNESPLSVE